MNEYIFYTTEGQTLAPDINYDVENCQVLGFARGDNATQAEENLLNAYSWITEAEFSREYIISRQVVTQ